MKKKRTKKSLVPKTPDHIRMIYLKDAIDQILFISEELGHPLENAVAEAALKTFRELQK